MLIRPFAGDGTYWRQLKRAVAGGCTHASPGPETAPPGELQDESAIRDICNICAMHN